MARDGRGGTVVPHYCNSGRGTLCEQQRVFQEIFGPVLAVTTFSDKAEAVQIANDTPYGLGAGVWTRDGSRAFRMGARTTR